MGDNMGMMDRGLQRHATTKYGEITETTVKKTFGPALEIAA
jgi:hypothetical protein